MADPTTMHFLDFVCDGWVGNFELELVSYVFDRPMYDHERRDLSGALTEAEQAEIEEQLGEDFLDIFDGEYGSTFVELGSAEHPVTGETVTTIRVRISDFAWQDAVDANTIAGIKARAEKFFTVLNDPARDAWAREPNAAFVGLIHTTAITTSVSEVL